MLVSGALVATMVLPMVPNRAIAEGIGIGGTGVTSEYVTSQDGEQGTSGEDFEAEIAAEQQAECDRIAAEDERAHADWQAECDRIEAHPAGNSPESVRGEAAGLGGFYFNVPVHSYTLNKDFARADLEADMGSAATAPDSWLTDK